MITPSFSPTATERVLPKLALDFTTATLDARVTFTRTTDATHPATYVNSSGVITSATNDQPRFDYDPIALTCKGLLIEESRANGLTYSDQFNNAAWGKTNSTVTANTITSPDGTVNADVFTATASTGYHLVERNSGYTTTSGNFYTASVFAKAGTNNFISVYIATTATDWVTVTFNLASGVMSQNLSSGAYSNVTPFINNFGNSWYRIGFSCKTTQTIAYFGTMLNSSATPTLSSYGYETWTAVGTETSYIWGAQLEAGAFATSYIPTTSAALTRNADVATMTGTNFSSWFNQNEGTFFGQADALSIGTTNQDYVIQVGYTLGVLADGINCGRNVGGTGGQAVTGMWQKTNDVNQAVLYSANNVVTVGTPYKFVGAYKNNSYAASINAATVLTDSSGTVQTNLDTFCIGKITGAPNTMSGHVQKIMYWPQRLTNAEVQAFAK